MYEKYNKTLKSMIYLLLVLCYCDNIFVYFIYDIIQQLLLLFMDADLMLLFNINYFLRPIYYSTVKFDRQQDNYCMYDSTTAVTIISM